MNGTDLIVYQQMHDHQQRLIHEADEIRLSELGLRAKREAAAQRLEYRLAQCRAGARAECARWRLTVGRVGSSLVAMGRRLEALERQRA